MSAGVISFDLDGTLIAGPFGKVLTDLQHELADLGVPDVKDAILQQHRRLLTTDPIAAYDWESIVEDYLATMDLQVPFALLDRLGEHIRRDETRLLHDQTFESFARLRSSGWRIVLLTNGWRRYQEPILNGIGLLDAVDELLAGDDVERPKPSPIAFAAARRNADRYVHVGDRIDHDIVGGNAVGAQTVLLRADVVVRGRFPEDDQNAIDYLCKLAVVQEVSAEEQPALMRPDCFAAELTEVVDWLS